VEVPARERIEMISALKNVVVFVRDMEKARGFYREALKLPLASESEFMMEFFPQTATTLGVALAMHEAALPLVGRHTGITLTVKDIDEFCRTLVDSGVTFVEPLERSPWGKMAVIADPDGNQFALVEG
jgi:predicted enzyme related to lactoylglutathione lyase